MSTPSRRDFLIGSGTLLAGCRLSPSDERPLEAPPLDRLLAAHASALPEARGAGADHDPMAAEALEALGREAAIPASWSARARSYAGALPREAPIGTWPSALGRYERYGDWIDFFEQELATHTWRDVLATWAPRLAPGLSGALFHGLLRTAHAARALRSRDTVARRRELANGLAYWAARYGELPTRDGETRSRLALHALDHAWIDDRSDVPFDLVMQRLQEHPLAPEIVLDTPALVPQEQLQAIVREAAEALLEMIEQARHPIWLLHTVTGPAAVGLLLPEVDEASAQRLVAYAQQAVVAVFRAYGAPYTPRAHLRPDPPRWDELIPAAVALESVHSIKLFEALVRFEESGDPLYRAVAQAWLAS
jgi:hypothetical protein